jgi:hypothetical protein
VQTSAGRYERPLPHFRLARWLVAPAETARAWRLAVTEGYWRPDDAIAAARTTSPTRTAGVAGITPSARPVPVPIPAATEDRPPGRAGTPTAPAPTGPGSGPVREQATRRRSPTGGTAGRSERQAGTASTPTDRAMRAYWQAERAKGRTPGGAELARAAGLDPETGAGRKARRRYLAEAATAPPATRPATETRTETGTGTGTGTRPADRARVPASDPTETATAGGTGPGGRATAQLVPLPPVPAPQNPAARNGGGAP